MTPRTHSPAHINESCYAAIRKALFPGGYPRNRDRDGRFVSGVRRTAARLRAELQSQANMPIQAAIESFGSDEQKKVRG
jgi:hypothetical protein